MTYVLHSAWRAGAPYRTRIGLELKGVPYEIVPVDLIAGQQRKPAYRAVNPLGLTPALEIGGGEILTQSLAILEWLEETIPEPPLLPRTPLDRARVRAMTDIIACDIHPLNNTRVSRALNKMGQDQASITAWLQGWIVAGFDALEPLIARHGEGFAFGDAPTMADCFLIPQVYSARRFEVDLAPYPGIVAVDARCAQHPAFQAAHPTKQPDAVAV
jgi:maleylacetoacetate isomerase